MATASLDRRSALQQQIAQLQSELKALDAVEIANKARSASNGAINHPPDHVPLSKRARKAQASVIGPLPPILAAQPKRHIALMFSYEGWAHSGLAWQPPTSPTPLPTVEGCILEALEKARLIEPASESDGFGCGFERCGRTDAGVSSSAQVINLWVRSDLEDPMDVGLVYDAEPVVSTKPRSRSNSATSSDTKLSAPVVRKARKAPSNVEIPYVTILNRHLPPTIRILAWSPVSASFSSRFSCIWRHYKYFFSSSALQPFHRSSFDFGSAYRADASTAEQRDWQRRMSAIDWRGVTLDVDAMRDAVGRLVGEHDYRNMCKVDPPKQLTTHRRTVISASIDHVEGEEPDLFVLNLRGGAFLYNQVRHIVALLFLVGARLETPDIIERLLWTSDRTQMTENMHPLRPGETRELMDRKPGYAMADDLPLILWQCGFNSTEFDWRIDNSPTAKDPPISPPAADTAHPDIRAKTALDPIESFRRQFLEMNETYTEARLKAVVLKHHLASFAFHCPSSPEASSEAGPTSPPLTYTPIGAGRSFKTSSYIPLLERKRGDVPEVANANWAKGRGARRVERREARSDEAGRIREVNLAKKAAAKAEEKRLAELEASQN